MKELLRLMPIILSSFALGFATCNLIWQVGAERSRKKALGLCFRLLHLLDELESMVVVSDHSEGQRRDGDDYRDHGEDGRSAG